MKSRQMRAGSYEMDAGISPAGLLRQLVRGEEAVRSVTLVDARRRWGEWAARALHVDMLAKYAGSRTVWAVVIFVGLSLALWAQPIWLPEYPLPPWVGMVVAALQAPVLITLRG
jgi:hypothetical protein